MKKVSKAIKPLLKTASRIKKTKKVATKKVK